MGSGEVEKLHTLQKAEKSHMQSILMLFITLQNCAAEWLLILHWAGLKPDQHQERTENAAESE